MRIERDYHEARVRLTPTGTVLCVDVRGNKR